MRNSLFQRIMAVFLASLMLIGTFVALPAFAADETGEESADAVPGGQQDVAGYRKSIEEVRKLLDTRSYDEYYTYNTVDRGYPMATDEIIINAADYNAEKTTAEVEVRQDYQGKTGSSLYMPDSGDTTWNFTVPATGMYAIEIEYYTEPGTYTTIERMLYLDGKLPFSEARYFYFPRAWEYTYSDTYGVFDTDRNGNDIRPIRQESAEWVTYYLRDWLGYTMDPFEFALTEGEHTLTFSAAREPIVISQIRIYPYEEEVSYEDYLAACKNKGAQEIKNVEAIVHYQGENPTKISNANLFPTNDRTSSLTEPQDPSCIRFNMLDSSVVNQWMRYEVTVPETGLYKIVTRFRQNSLIGMFTSRRIYINGEVPFREASYLRFKFSPEWQNLPLNDGATEFLFYLEEGKNEITFEIVLGSMMDYVYRIQEMIVDLNAAYQKFLMITGPSPDAQRDYAFSRSVPEAIMVLAKSAKELYAIADELEAITGELGDQVATLNTIAILFEIMAEDEYEIAPNFITFKNYIVALSNWLYASLSQPMKLDYFTIQGTEDKIPRGKANFFQSAWFEIRAFIKSFTMDYTTIGFKSDVVMDKSKEVEMWIVSAGGRDDALIQRYIIDNYFTPQTGISITIKVVSAGLTEAILAGIGPDIAGLGSNDCITWGMRNAIEVLNDMEGFDEAVTWFDKSAIDKVSMYGKTYGLPSGMSYNMVFYRTDVLATIGVDVPTTWNDLYDILPKLQNKHLQIALPVALEGTQIFLYQLGGDLYADDGMKVNLDSDIGLEAFTKLCDMFTKYKCPVAYDITRFRTGEMPIWVGDGIGTYNTLMSFYELRGLWEMAPLLGFEDEEGVINCSSVIGVSAMVIPRGANNPEATWEYMKWYVGEETQLRFAKEQLAVSANPTTKFGSANTSAVRKLAWTEEEFAAIDVQLDNLVSIPDYPGNYITSVYVSNAFYEVYNTFSNPVNSMQDRILDINKEISRKRREFKLDYYDIGYGATVSGDQINGD